MPRIGFLGVVQAFKSCTYEDIDPPQITLRLQEKFEEIPTKTWIVELDGVSPAIPPNFAGRTVYGSWYFGTSSMPIFDRPRKSSERMVLAPILGSNFSEGFPKVTKKWTTPGFVSEIEFTLSLRNPNQTITPASRVIVIFPTYYPVGIGSNLVCYTNNTMGLCSTDRLRGVVISGFGSSFNESQVFRVRIFGVLTPSYNKSSTFGLQ
eukprot:TRINITY_DN15565_c0_g1_i1.p1 TRINITY_DN15565_c0_g1~~TRINITY_DN15565_c0_g1_i1.p1  ORF type:complete len:207 (+),score=6.80 TRINITY_DN15565_c0_g1_i1:81-701(+)